LEAISIVYIVELRLAKRTCSEISETSASEPAHRTANTASPGSEDLNEARIAEERRIEKARIIFNDEPPPFRYGRCFVKGG
jgi:hypothetical protein